MIEPTDEMVELFRRAFNQKAADVAATAPDFIEGSVITRAGLAAVLAIVERDYKVEPRSGGVKVAVWAGEAPHQAFGRGYSVGLAAGLRRGRGGTS